MSAIDASTVAINTIAFGVGAKVSDALTGVHGLGDLPLTVPEWVIANSGWEAGITELKESGHDVACLLRPAWFRLDDPSQWDQQRVDLTRVVDAAAELGAPYVYGTTGSAGELEFDEAVRAFDEAVAPVRDHARDRGVELLIESTNSLRTDINFVFTLRDQIDVCRETGIGLCVDLVAVWPERDVVALLEAAASDARIVQIGDFVGGTIVSGQRVVLGDGDIPLDRILDALSRGGFGGILDVEILGPRIDEEQPSVALRRSLDWLDARPGRTGDAS